MPGAFSVASGEGAVWALGAAGALFKIDPGSGELAGQTVQVANATDVAAGLGFVWVASGAGTVTRFDPSTGSQVGKPIAVGAQPQALAIGEGAVWVASAKDGSVHRITP